MFDYNFFDDNSNKPVEKVDPFIKLDKKFKMKESDIWNSKIYKRNR